MAQPRPRKTKDFDGRSNVSSFYGAQSTHEPSPTYGSRGGAGRRDSQSTFFGRNGEDYNPNQLQYEADPLREHDAQFSRHYPPPPDAIEPVKYDDEPVSGGKGAGWDVFADFNNTGPRYSNVPLAANFKSNDGYRPLPPPESMSSRRKGAASSSAYEPQVELVTVPAMGAEWSAQELADMKKATKRQQAADERKRAWREFARDQKGLCGIPYLTRTKLVYIMFAFVIALGLLLYFLIPRAPDFGFEYGTPIKSNGGPTPYFNRVPANFSFTAGVDLQADTHASYIPIHFRNISASLYATETSKLVATGSWGPQTIAAKAYVPVMINMTFAYEGINTSDTTWNLYYDACKNSIQYPNGTRPGLNVRLILEMDIVGLVGKQGATTLINQVPCPIMLPTNAG
ncbi:hypothetical protein FRB94_012923 [Tulasnella sp. JGI-2019a]|nr:hypothetical protein FRB93_001594 [Tulasnella sp. JGI-2019a]KAG9008826.1 hypothetical protein FRB94_012923 [Tulasnella sp. JGI-2019a]